MRRARRVPLRALPREIVSLAHKNSGPPRLASVGGSCATAIAHEVALPAERSPLRRPTGLHAVASPRQKTTRHRPRGQRRPSPPSDPSPTPIICGLVRASARLDAREPQDSTEGFLNVLVLFCFWLIAFGISFIPILVQS